MSGIIADKGVIRRRMKNDTIEDSVKIPYSLPIPYRVHTCPTIILREGSITGPTVLPSTRNEEDIEDVCSWTSGVLQLTECTTTISRQDFTHLSQGVVNMKGGSFKVETSLFHDNNPTESSFPALRRNVFCSEDGTVDVGSMTEGDGYDGSSGWFSTSGCSVSGLASLVVSSFFVPSLSTSSTSSFDKKKEIFEIEVKGSTLIPCGLILEVQHEMEVEKYEEIEDDANAPTAHVSSVRELNGNTLNVGHWTEKEQKETRKNEEETEEREIPFENRVCGLNCAEKSGNVEVVRRWAQLSVARGLAHAMKMSEYSAILTELTSHSVVLSGERKMNLILKTDSIQPDPMTEQPTQLIEENNENKQITEETDTPLTSDAGSPQPKQTHSQPTQIVRPHPLRQSEVHQDDVRWQAPEEGEEREERRESNEGEVGKSIDRTKASVFRLGLVLWEIQTGLVPFAEQDGVNAHRNLSIGIVPPMEGVGEKMKELIEECLSVNPDARPSVDSIISRLSSMDGKVSAQKDLHIAIS
ncbi:hypothetical protein BLNAU_19905 [Blattamonas nauphoetae]|uniref:Protein kinase domain-containing protein n=1 Tax=Blattamonas nauphoetae TaxID=2049346 RepID=A0ABQ9X045_9EUKA|nr:hypothetical protein BLNAU_19905 [Blattamonas nauphoetae]